MAQSHHELTHVVTRREYEVHVLYCNHYVVVALVKSLFVWCMSGVPRVFVFDDKCAHFKAYSCGASCVFAS